MARRPYIEPKIIKNSFHPNRSSSRPNEYVSGAVKRRLLVWMGDAIGLDVNVGSVVKR